MHIVGFATYVACIALLFTGTLYRAPVAIAAVLCMFGLDQLGQISHPWLLQRSTFTNYVVGVLVLLALFRRRESIVQLLASYPKQLWLTLALYSYALISLLWTSMPSAGWEQWQANGPYIVVVALVSPLLIVDAGELRLALRWTALIGLLLATVIMVFGEWGIRGLIVGGGSSAQESNPLALAGFAGVVAASALFVGTGFKGALDWVLRLASVVVCLMLIVRSGSRGQLIAVVVSIAMMLPVRYRLSSFRGFVPILLTVAAIAVGLDYGASMYAVNDESRWSGDQAMSDVTGRFDMVLALLSHWSSSPISILFGLGNSASFDPQIVGIYLHNMPFEVLGEEGLIGFALFATILVSSTVAFVRARRIAGQSQDSATLAAIGGAATFFLVLSLKQGSLLGNYSVFMSALLMARIAISIVNRPHVAEAEAPAALTTTHRFANLMR